MKNASRKTEIIYLILLTAIFSLIFIRSAWVVDDAYITFRTIDNFIHGYGLTWNTIERVQVYTHPLWMLLVSFFSFFTREYFFTTLSISLSVSLLSIYFAHFHLKKPGDYFRSILFFTFIVTSKSILDYSSSGLENPLSHLFIIIFYSIYLTNDPQDEPLSEKKTALLFLIANLSFLNRQDTILLYLPALISVAWRLDKKALIRLAILSSLPSILWLLFSTFYYGSPFPNTAYAKMVHNGIPLIERIRRGTDYFLLSMRWDALGFFIIPVALFYSIINKNWKAFQSLCAILIYFLYILISASSATHMLGRFLSTPLLLGFFVSAYLVTDLTPIFRTVN